MKFITVLTILSVFMIQCAPIGKPYRQGQTPLLGGQQDDSKTTPDQNAKKEEPRPFFTGNHKFEDLKPYELPKEILPFVPEELKPVEQGKPRLVLHNPILEVDMEKSKMTVTVDVEITGTGVKEKLKLDGDFSKTDPMWNADLFPIDEKISGEKRVQAIAACLDAHYCKNIAIRVYYKYKNEILEEQVESNKRIVSELEIDEESEAEGHDHSAQQTQPRPEPQTQSQGPQVQETQAQEAQHGPIETNRSQIKRAGSPSQPLPSEDTNDHSSSNIESSSPKPSEVNENESEQNPSELDYLMKMIWKKIVPKTESEGKPDTTKKDENKEQPTKLAEEKKDSETIKPKEVGPIEPIKIEPVKVDPPKDLKKEEPKKTEAPKKIEPIQLDLNQLNKPQAEEKPKVTPEQIAKREKNLVVALPTPLPAPKTDDKRSIPGLKDKVFIPSKEESCTTSKTNPCQSYGGHNSGGSLRQATEFPNNKKEILRIANSRRGAYHQAWGNSSLVNLILKASEEDREKYSSAKQPLYITQISKQAGGRSDVSKSHQNGLDADVLWPGNTAGLNSGPSDENLGRSFDFMKSIVCTERSHVRLFFVRQDIKKRLCLYAKAKYPEAVKNTKSCEYRTLYSLLDQYWPRGMDNDHLNHMHIRSHCPRYEGCAPDDPRPSCIHAYCQDNFVIPNAGHNIGC